MKIPIVGDKWLGRGQTSGLELRTLPKRVMTVRKYIVKQGKMREH